MDKLVKNIELAFLDILIINKLITDSQLANINLNLVDNIAEQGLFYLMIQQGILDNEIIIELLSNHQILLLLDINQHQIIIKDYTKITHYVREGYFIYQNNFQKKHVVNELVVNDLTQLKKLAINNYDLPIKLIRKKDFYQLFEQKFSHLNIIKAKYFLEFISSSMVAKNINYPKSMLLFFVIYFMILFKFAQLFQIINIICYFLQNTLKIILFHQAIIDQNTKFQKKPNELILPIYTILLPLYKETTKLNSIIKSIDNLTYPKDKLDVMIIIEADDHSLLKEITLTQLPYYIQIIKVPACLPRTKPKALNYATQYCKGKYLVIYDAEDRPEPDQLLKAVIEFEQLPEKYVCLQAKLNFYNENENLLAKFFSIEYSLWFKYLLKGLSILDLPVPLGGTSNHFKFDILQKVGFWDAYNVTEDADLGVRLYSYGYKVHMIDSYTLEESPITLISWINQRSRWIKGFIQTFLVFLARKENHKRFKFYQIIAIIIFIGFSSYGFYSLPFLLLTIKLNKLTIINYL